MRKRPNSITVMPLMPMLAYGITSADMKSLKVKPILTRLKRTTLSCAIIWQGWQGLLAVSRVAPMHWRVRYVCSCTASIAGNSISSSFQHTRPMSKISLPHYFNHSLVNISWSSIISNNPDHLPELSTIGIPYE